MNLYMFYNLPEELGTKLKTSGLLSAEGMVTFCFFFSRTLESMAGSFLTGVLAMLSWSESVIKYMVILTIAVTIQNCDKFVWSFWQLCNTLILTMKQIKEIYRDMTKIFMQSIILYYSGEKNNIFFQLNHQMPKLIIYIKIYHLVSIHKWAFLLLEWHS